MSENINDQPEAETEAKTTSAADQPQEQEECPELRSAAEAVAKAKAELEAAQRLYEQVRQKAVKKIHDLRECNWSAALEETRCFVKKHPGLSVTLGAFAGFYLGRWFQKLFRR
jgi:ElaB/YqjD/DUF883 family membrane-anchored ribosome-binding protein